MSLLNEGHLKKDMITHLKLLLMSINVKVTPSQVKKQHHFSVCLKFNFQ